MIKKFFCFSVATIFALSACDSENSTGPTTDNTISSNSRIGTLPGSSSSSKEYALPLDKNDCVVEKLSDTSTVMTIVLANTYIATTKATFTNNTVLLEIQTDYSENIDASMVSKVCNENKDEAKLKNATVICEDRSITVRETVPAETSLDATYIHQREACAEFIESLSAYNPDEGTSTEPTQPTGENQATCEVKRTTDNLIEIYIAQRDSGSITMTTSFENGIIKTETIFEFDPKVLSTDVYTETCQEFKNDRDFSDIVCKDDKIYAKTEEFSDINPMSIIGPEIAKYCTKIQATGVIPED